MRWGAIAITVAGCSYSPGSFHHGLNYFPGTRTTVGCLDLAVDRRADHDGWSVLSFEFANRCEGPQTVDLAHLDVVGRDAEGREHTLRPFDPDGTIRPLPLDGRLSGAEALSYPAHEAMVQVCVDVATLGDDAGPSRWMCFARKGLPLREDEPGFEAEAARTAAADADADANRSQIVDDEAPEVTP